MSLRVLLRRAVVGLVSATLIGSACSAGTDSPKPLDDWRVLALPAGMVPSTLSIRENGLLIGGYRPTGQDRAPALAHAPLDGTDVGPAPVALTPATPYGQIADLVSLTGDEDSVVALGAAHGGAHANFRWTIWTGTTSGVVDLPQTFETFGGWEAGTLLGVATDARGPLVVGTWQGAYGQDGAVWRPEGGRWVRQPAVAALANTRERQVAPKTVDQQADRSVVVSGSVIDLTDGVRQSAVTWRDVDGTWSLTELADPGQRSAVWSTGCDSACWSVGSRDGAVAAWSADARAEIPSLTAADTDAGRVLLWRDRTILAVSSAGSGRLLVGRGGRWQVYTAPDGIVRAAALHGTRLYLVTGSGDSARLLTRDLADVLE